MASKSKRRQKRTKRQKHQAEGVPIFDVHAASIMTSVAEMATLMESFASTDDPEAALEAAYTNAVDEFVDQLRHHNPIQLVEVSRLASLPMAPAGEVAITTDAGAARVELVAAMSLAAQRHRRAEHGEAAEQGGAAAEQPSLRAFVAAVLPQVDQLVMLAQMREMMRADRENPVTLIGLRIRGSEVFMRNSSYPELVEKTLRQLFCDNETVRDALIEHLGFTAEDALDVLAAVDSLQAEAMNVRLFAMADAVHEGMSQTSREGHLDPELRGKAQRAWQRAWEPDEEAATVDPADIASTTGIDATKVQLVLDHFTLDLEDASPVDVVNAFTTGANPMRVRPVLATDSGRVMLPHNALTVVAVRQSLEAALKTTTAWNAYAKHRGDLLESRVSAALAKVFPGATTWEGFEYFVPDTQEQLEKGEPDKYTKRVEGDHLIVLDDVAVIVEDKAVALSELARGGKLVRAKTDLTGLITKAAEQAGRLRDAIIRDGGIRIEGEGWTDLSGIREIHTVAVSLDDLSSVATATAELVRAGFLQPNNIPWTVSLHDLDLIVDLVDRPAEFLLYLQRRRNPLVTDVFNAADELDFFLYFFESGLWVEPDPDEVRATFPFLPPVTVSERRRHREQARGYITSRTDALDQWFYSTHPRTGVPTEEYEDPRDVPKPKMVGAPLGDIIDELQSRKVPGWLSIGAMLLGQATDAQEQSLRDIRSMIKTPREDGRGCSVTAPITGTTVPEEGWLLVWATHPVGGDRSSEVQQLRDYLRAKKAQLSIPRGVLFLFAESTGDLLDVIFDSSVDPLPPELAAKARSLLPPSALAPRQHPAARRRK